MNHDMPWYFGAVLLYNTIAYYPPWYAMVYHGYHSKKVLPQHTMLFWCVNFYHGTTIKSFASKIS